MRWFLILGWSALLAWAAAPPPPGTPDPEDELKAATVLAFLQNSTWPDETAADRSLAVGVWGRPAIVQALRRGIEGKSVNGRVVRIVELPSAVDPRCCRVQYVATDRKADIQRALAAAAAARALTIGEDDRFLENGGAVNLFLVDGHMAFDVSLAALERCGVSISSRLLRFGRVRLAPPRGPA